MDTYITLPTVTDDETRFGIAGDWHGNLDWASKRAIPGLAKRGIKTIFHLGDFGIWPTFRGSDFLFELNRELQEWDMYIYVTLGNHEDYNQVEDTPTDPDGLKWIRDRIILFPRVCRFEIKDKKFLSLGGAASVDYKLRTLDIDWWKQEMITDADVDAARWLGHADVMLAHEAPDNGTRTVSEIIMYNPMGLPAEAVNYAKEGRDRMTKAVQHVRPDLFMHGHYHVYDEGMLYYGSEKPGKIISFANDGQDYNTGILDIDNIFDVEVLV